jgi:hypothetical protein
MWLQERLLAILVLQRGHERVRHRRAREASSSFFLFDARGGAVADYSLGGGEVFGAGVLAPEPGAAGKATAVVAFLAVGLGTGGLVEEAVWGGISVAHSGEDW